MRTLGIDVAPENENQARAWDGDEGEYWAANADWFEGGLDAYRAPLMAAAAIRPGEAVLDLGCGTGQTTRDAARAAAPGEAVGIDLSSRMVAEAGRRAEAEGLANARFVHGDAQIHPFPAAAFDVIVSRTAASFFGDPVAALANAARALRPGGRLVVMTWQGPPANEWLSEWSTALTGGRGLPAPPPGAPSPFALADPTRLRDVVAQAGFGDVAIDDVAAPFVAGRDPAEAFDLIVGLASWMSEGLTDDERAGAREALRASLEAHATPGGVLYRSATWVATGRRA